MKKKIAPLAMLFGLLGALMLGGASVASAGTGWDCSQKQKGNVVKVDVNCVLNNVDVDVNVEIYDIRVLTGNEISILENNLNNADVNIEVIEDVVIKTLNDFNIVVADNQVKVCAAVVGVLFKQCT